MAAKTSESTPPHAPRGSTKKRGPNWKGLLFTTLKFGVASALVGFMLRSGTLDVGALRLLVNDGSIFAMNLFVWLVAVSLTTLRWRILLRLVDAKVSWPRSFALQLVAILFNVVVPGNVGGDMLKAVYVARNEPKEKRAPLMLIVIVERLLGLGGLVMMASFVILANSKTSFSTPELKALSTTVLLLGLGVVGGPALFVLVFPKIEPWLSRRLSGTSRLIKLAETLVRAIAMLSHRPMLLVASLGVSMLMHAVSALYFTFLTRLLISHDANFSSVATIFPLGMLSIVLPISPAGIGVGHLAFKRLFGLIGVEGGATVFNIYLVGQIAPAVVGVVPYLFLKSKNALPAEDEAQAVADEAATTNEAVASAKDLS